MKSILIPTDFSQNASDALDYALHLYKGHSVKIHIIHCIEPVIVPSNTAGSTIPITNTEMEQAHEAMNALQEFGNLFLGELPNSKLSITTSVEIGNAASCIKNKATELGIDLVIMGTQGSKHSFAEKIMGTISTAVLDNAPCPVILVPLDYKFKPLDNIIFSTNLNHSDPYELWKATQLLYPNIAKVRCLFVTPDMQKVDSKEIEEFATYILDHSPTVESIFNMEESKYIEETITKYAESYNAELIIMQRSKKSLWKTIFSTRHTKKMAFWTKVPLLILN